MEDLSQPGAGHSESFEALTRTPGFSSIETDAARRMPGVVASVGSGPARATEGSIPPLLPAPRHSGANVHPAIARDTVRHVGEAVAIVAADDPYRVADAMEAVRIEYESLPGIGDRGGRARCRRGPSSRTPGSTTLPALTAAIAIRKAP